MRPLADTIEVRAPLLASLAVRLLLRLPPAMRTRALQDAFARAENAFNRGDLHAVFALFAPHVEYVPPPALHSGAPIIGRDAVMSFWQDVFALYPRSSIENRSIEEALPGRFVRTATLTHENSHGRLQYSIRQVTELRSGRVVRQVNETLELS